MVKRKKLNKDLTLIFTPHFPYNANRNSRMRYRALLGIGGNVGDVLRRFEHFFWYLKDSEFIHLLESSPILKNPPFGFLEQDDFLNATLLVETDLTPKQLLRYVLRIEKKFGRKRLFKDGPRTLDIDLIFYEDIRMESRELTLPHPSWMQRASVLIPLSMMKEKVNR
ncbi:2-amino-4-hydroxy-6-hydroxymethyldihydropteridine diphosphokinase [Sulfurovum sp. NBC37-1]|uniref:2-amino-4-hydroxy-6- hydroxymethyldihydropteridine diphosphokinase n=1 Tax=Sulfurovum sp. (strain NBC37-1) TaxID=387093 RepID=UPI0001587876|nr:2-amino-4-hydroxy-6-hydroxymethyldihydropteridine diphosphokinase [Sulfurovum sp. NBC37-1]BAF71997.1 2-amino-4-hydroxy-6-hydroxymethyldihydropteridine pyrophosphokinase [Sulfurovum sp. NBC37-1]